MNPNVTWIVRDHSIHVGMDYRTIVYNNQNVGSPFRIQATKAATQKVYNTADSLSGNSVASLLIGSVGGGYADYNVLPSFVQRYYAPFIQDDWKVSSRVMLNLGLRYEHIGAPTERFNRYSNFDPKAMNSLTKRPGTVKFANVDFGRSIYSPEKKNFAPRVGFAYDLTGKNRIIVRGGYGIYYYQSSGTFILGPYMGFTTTSSYSAFNGQPAFQMSKGIPFVNTPLGPKGGDATFLGSSPSYFETGRKTPYVQQWSFGT
jgi:outer membrane receptor protein involved in Fe transport